MKIDTHNSLNLRFSYIIGFRNQETTCIDKIDYIDFVDYQILSIGHTRNLKKGKNSYGETP